MATRTGLPTPSVWGELHSEAAENFSLTRGGPFYRLQIRLGGAEQERTRVARRALAAALLTWLPLLVLSMAQGLAYGQHVRIPFLYDLAANVRFLVALPLLILCEVGIDQSLRTVVTHFLKSGLVKEPELPSFEEAIGRLTRLRDHVLPEMVILAAAFLPSLSIRSMEGLLLWGVSTWHSVPGGMPSSAGWWFRLVSAPVWLWRMFLWASFIWRASRLNLGLIPTHPDMAAGLGFLSEGQRRFATIAFAGGAVMAGQVGNALAYEGSTISQLKFVLTGYCVFAIMLLVAPLLLPIPTLLRVKRRGLLEYGAMATRYTQMFDAKWVHGSPPKGETLLGNSDIQSLADMGNSFAIVRGMSVAPIDKRTLIWLAIAAVLPMVPVLLLGTPADELIRTVMKLLA